jgi:hypothetical protein
MPTVNIYLREIGTDQPQIDEGLIHELREKMAGELSCGARKLQAKEITVRCLPVKGNGMIAPVEVDITAHAYEERIKRADSICLTIREFLMEKIPSAEDVRVWLNLTELGHSWEED